MPRRQEPMKDATNSDMLRGAVSRLRSGDFRMGKPSWGNAQLLMSEYIAHAEAYPGN
jgi:hypothetical protein